MIEFVRFKICKEVTQCLSVIHSLYQKKVPRIVAVQFHTQLNGRQIFVLTLAEKGVKCKRISQVNKKLGDQLALLCHSFSCSRHWKVCVPFHVPMVSTAM